MKKIPNLFIALYMVAMFFSGCKFLGDTAGALLPEDRTATIEDFQGTWQWKSDNTESTNQNESTGLVKSLDFIIEDNTVFMIPDSIQEEEIKFSATVENGILSAYNRLFGTLQMTVKVGKTNLSITGDKLVEFVGVNIIKPIKIFDTTSLPFIPDTTVNFENYEGTWTNTEKKVTFSFGTENLTGKNLQLVTIVGLTEEFSTPNLVIVAKGVATTTFNKDVYFMYMNKEHNGITVTGPKIKELTGVYCFNLEKNTK